MLDPLRDAVATTAGHVPLSPHWRLSQDGDTIRCVGGPDEFYVLTELAPTTRAEIMSWVDAGQAPIDAADEPAEALRFLQTIGAISTSERPAGVLSWLCVGPDAATSRLAAAVDAINPPIAEDLLVVVRTGGSLAELAEQASVIDDRRQLLVDLTGHHTVSLGPLVVPGFTACIGCYCSRIAVGWGDEAGAAEPATQRWTATAAELLSIQIELLAKPGSPLLNATINWDLQRGVSTRDRLLRTQQCTRCSHRRSGRVPLPWQQA